MTILNGLQRVLVTVVVLWEAVIFVLWRDAAHFYPIFFYNWQLDHSFPLYHNPQEYLTELIVLPIGALLLNWLIKGFFQNR